MKQSLEDVNLGSSKASFRKIKNILKSFKREFELPSPEDFKDLRHLRTFSVDTPGTIAREDCIAVGEGCVYLFQPVRGANLIASAFFNSYHPGETVPSIGVRVYRERGKLKFSEPFLALAKNDVGLEFGHVGQVREVEFAMEIMAVPSPSRLVDESAKVFRLAIGRFLNRHGLPVIECIRNR